MDQDDATRRMLHDIVGRADHVGHVILEGEELAFARTREGAKWLEPIDPGRHLYKVAKAARQQLTP